ncbi:Leaf rust 10 disease-resistance locus receptor-like protein kinase [Actinidia chinensis var. chinensis]|uniref:Leaf rust 10 disease-resistance locus receptor-like protein kinase n=1 Tax=Actinidia chinensis var. chinensis TaxID=1590841 RepID=A0A2R6PBE0_ACTCC|nr:Leaf rust 10 disease-resistance locus receptor-like protein kinase [Actinidia chinensis var. chinensis]
MPLPSFFSLFFLSHLLLPPSAGEGYKHCPDSFNCGIQGSIKFPLSSNSYPECGLFTVNCSEPIPKINLGLKEQWYDIIDKVQDNEIRVHDRLLGLLINTTSCDIFSFYLNWSLYPTPSVAFTSYPTLTLFKCTTTNSELDKQKEDYFRGNHSYSGCRGYTVYYQYPDPHREVLTTSFPRCSVIELPVVLPKGGQNTSDLFSILASEFTIRFNVSNKCSKCHRNGGQCSQDHHEFRCLKEKKGRSYSTWILATGIPGFVILLLCLLILIMWRGNKRNYTSDISSNSTSSHPFANEKLEGSSAYYGVPVFSYTELEEATHNFDPSKELGDGGFGAVYHGKLRDGREVAVKRFYEHRYKRVKQFMNEIEILTYLSHPNLVTLYGCTSRKSQELLLVYEYIPNGTVADHLHGDRAKDGSVSWPIRMNIAIETASALAYLHASDIIHRDVKTNNILLDKNFCVKVADFGLSRLFPADVTHVSTAPQGTPGYVDPEYHQCYQLTDKSDVYSFGVVLIELISSMPAVDINRHRHEINLANFAINRIKNRVLNELIDPSLGFESDSSIERMTTSVAELAFLCLQLGKEMRPTMDEVLEALKEIKSYKDDNTGEINETGGVLKSIRLPSSPESEDEE